MAESGSSSIRVLCVDDNADIAALLVFAINAEADFECVGSVTQSEQVLSAIAEHKPHVIILDFSMPGRHPLEVVGDVGAAFPDVRVIIYSGYDDAETVDRAMEAGAWGYVSKHSEMPRLMEAIRQVAGGQVTLLRE